MSCFWLNCPLLIGSLFFTFSYNVSDILRQNIFSICHDAVCDLSVFLHLFCRNNKKDMILKYLYNILKQTIYRFLFAFIAPCLLSPKDGKHSDRLGGRCITAVMMRCFWFSISRKQKLQLCQEFLAFNIHPLEQCDTSGSSGSFGPCWSLGESSRGARSLSLGATQHCLMPRKPQETWGCWQSYLIFPTSASGVKRTKHMDKTNCLFCCVYLVSFTHLSKKKKTKQSTTQT